MRGRGEEINTRAREAKGCWLPEYQVTGIRWQEQEAEHHVTRAKPRGERLPRRGGNLPVTGRTGEASKTHNTHTRLLLQTREFNSIPYKY